MTHDEKKPVMRPVEALEAAAGLDEARELPPEAQTAEGALPTPTLPPYQDQPMPTLAPRYQEEKEEPDA